MVWELTLGEKLIWCQISGLLVLQEFWISLQPARLIVQVMLVACCWVILLCPLLQCWKHVSHFQVGLGLAMDGVTFFPEGSFHFRFVQYPNDFFPKLYLSIVGKNSSVFSTSEILIQTSEADTRLSCSSSRCLSVVHSTAFYFHTARL